MKLGHFPTGWQLCGSILHCGESDMIAVTPGWFSEEGIFSVSISHYSTELTQMNLEKKKEAVAPISVP